MGRSNLSAKASTAPLTSLVHAGAADQQHGPLGRIEPMGDVAHLPFRRRGGGNGHGSEVTNIRGG